jgi:hypothetical protein
MPKEKSNSQLIWGVAFTAMGFAVFFKIIPDRIMPWLDVNAQASVLRPFVLFCFYFMGIMLVGGGLKKVYHYFKNDGVSHTDA